MAATYPTDNGPDGSVLGFSTGKVAFFKGTPGSPGTAVTQPFGTDQAQFNRGQAGGVIAT